MVGRFLWGLVLLAALSGPGHAQKIRSFSVAGWEGGVYATNGEFSHCLGMSRASDGVYMMFTVNRVMGWSVALHDFASTLRSKEFNLTLVIDDGQPIAVRAMAIDSHTLEIPLADSANLFTQFRRGRQLRVVAPRIVLTFNLDGTSALLPSLVECVQQELNPRRQNNVASARQSVAPASVAPASSTPAHQAEATVMLANVLSLSGVSGFVIAPAEEAAKLKVDAAWMAGEELGGALRVFPTLQVNDPKLQSHLIGYGAEQCKGAFLSGSLPETSDKKKVVRIFTTCQEGAKTTTAYHTAIPRPKGGIYLFSTASIGNEDAFKAQDNVKRADDGLRSAVFQVVK